MSESRDKKTSFVQKMISLVFLLQIAHLQAPNAPKTYKTYRVYTDLDDTAFAAGYGSVKTLFSGADVTKRHGRTYAGYESFLFHLSTPAGKGVTNATINICSARSGIFGSRLSKAKLEDHINSLRAQLDPPTAHKKRVFVGKVLYGNVFNFPSYERYGMHKYRQIRSDVGKFKERNGGNGGNGGNGYKEGETGIIFIGDNGQGDAKAGRLLLKEKIVDYVFIHVVVGQEIVSSEDGGDNMILFRNYRDAAALAAMKGVISDEVKDQIIEDYENELEKYSHLERIIERGVQ